jgi:hypothetical protein
MPVVAETADGLSARNESGSPQKPGIGAFSVADFRY